MSKCKKPVSTDHVGLENPLLFSLGLFFLQTLAVRLQPALYDFTINQGHIWLTPKQGQRSVAAHIPKAVTSLVPHLPRVDTR